MLSIMRIIPRGLAANDVDWYRNVSADILPKNPPAIGLK